VTAREAIRAQHPRHRRRQPLADGACASGACAAPRGTGWEHRRRRGPGRARARPAREGRGDEASEGRRPPRRGRGRLVGAGGGAALQGFDWSRGGAATAEVLE
jgi:hypothetical protein